MVEAEKSTLFLVDLEKRELFSAIVDRGTLLKPQFVAVEPIR